MSVFNQKVAAITGAGSGIGRELALQLAQKSCHLSLSDVDEQGLVQTIELINNSKIKITSQKVDVAQQAQVQAWAEHTIQEHGAVHFIFNNAGVALGSTVEGASYEELNWIMDINFWGVVYGTKEFLPLIKQAGEGYVINISSLFGLVSQPTQSAYNATKFAVRGFTESLIQELELENSKVGALCVHPGGIRTNIANSARSNESLNRLGLSTNDFNRFLRCPPEEAARQILAAVQNKQRRLLIGYDAKALDLVQRFLPTHYSKVIQFLNRFVEK